MDVVRSSVVGTELGYAQITTDDTLVRSGSDVTEDITGLSVTVTVGARPILITFSARTVKHSANGGFASIRIQESSTVLADAVVQNPSGAAINFVPVHRQVRLAPSAGSHTYKVVLVNALVDGTATLAATSTSPAFIQVTEV